MSASFKLNDTEIFSELNQTVTAKNINVAANDLTTPSMCKAWVNFDGTLSMTVDSSYGPNVGNLNPIRAAYNVDYIIDRGQGDFEVHFENAMADANYAVAHTVGDNSSQPQGRMNYDITLANNSYRFKGAMNTSNALLDTAICTVIVFR